MIRHVVLLRFQDATPPGTLRALEGAFAALAGQIREVAALEWGTNVSPEGLAKGYTHCFLLSFALPADRDAYLPHPAHLAFVAQLKPWLADVLVIDYATA